MEGRGGEGRGPLTDMLSPMWASSRIAAALAMVSEVPPPPVAVSSCGINDETAGCSKSDFFNAVK